MEKQFRTDTQNKAMHLWFQQVADECNKNSVDAKLVMSKVMRMDMTPEFIKAMWKTLQRALYGTKSTTELKKAGEIDKLYDHFVRFFAENFEMELPPFPNDEEKGKLLLDAMKLSSNIDYPNNFEEPTI